MTEQMEEVQKHFFDLESTRVTHEAQGEQTQVKPKPSKPNQPKLNLPTKRKDLPPSSDPKTPDQSKKKPLSNRKPLNLQKPKRGRN